MNIWVDANGWPVPPAILLGCLVAEILYFRGWSLLIKAEQRKAARTSTSPAVTASQAGAFRWDSWFWRSIYFLGALFVFLLASSAPIDILSARLFWVHMIQHLLILVIMAPLLVAGAPFLPLWLGLPRWTRRLIKTLRVGRTFYELGRWLRHPALSCALLIVGTWAWHWPPLYDLALTNSAIHDWLEHTTFLAVSVLLDSDHTINATLPSPGLSGTYGVHRLRYRTKRCSGCLARICPGTALCSLCSPGYRSRRALCITRSAVWGRLHVDIRRSPVRHRVQHSHAALAQLRNGTGRCKNRHPNASNREEINIR